MMRAVIRGEAVAALAVLGLACGRVAEEDVDPVTTTPAAAAAGAHEGLIYGRVTMENGDVYEGRLRWGGDEEALWGNYFNGFEGDNPWIAHVPAELRPSERVSIGAFGFELVGWDREIDLGRPLMVRFGDIARIEPDGRVIRATLKSGAVIELDRYAADDVADGLRVWDDRLGEVDLGEWRIRSIELLPTPRLAAAPDPLHGTVRTASGDFTGFLQWDRRATLAHDQLEGQDDDGEMVGVPFSAIRSIARSSTESARVTLVDGREVVLSGTRAVGQDRRGNINNGTYVDDPRYGRVLVSWSAFERVDFAAGGAPPAYDAFPPGSPLTGSVVTRSGRLLAGRLVYDLDESETTETLDAPSQGVDYTIPFGLVRSIVPAAAEEVGGQPAVVTLHSGEELRLGAFGDLGPGNAGVLIFPDGGARPEYVPWADVERVDLQQPPAMFPRAVIGSGR